MPCLQAREEWTDLLEPSLPWFTWVLLPMAHLTHPTHGVPPSVIQPGRLHSQFYLGSLPPVTNLACLEASPNYLRYLPLLAHLGQCECFLLL